MWKKIFACMLCLILVAVPFVQRTHAVVTTATLAAVLILTVMVAMGITLVVAEGSKEDFVLNKGSSFMTAKGYSGSFSDWILSGTETEIGLRTGFLVLSKTVVNKIKEFVDWLIPNAASNTTHEFVGDGPANLLDGFIVYSGRCEYSRSGNPFVYVTDVGKLWRSSTGDPDITVQGQNTSVEFYNLHGTDYMKVTNGYNATSGALVNNTWTKSHNITSGMGFTLLKITEFMNRSFLPGVYAIQWVGDENSAFNFIGSSSSPIYSFQLSELTVESTGDAAIIGNYHDLDDLTDTTTVGAGGTTVIHNTFYITSDGQALDPSSQDLADILDALRQALENISQKVDVIGWTLTQAAEGEVNPNYSDFELGKLDFNGLRALITTRFPFCIPWDFVRIIELFVADPEAPHWEFDLIPISAMENVDTTLSLDLGDYPIVGTVSRWFCIIDLCLGLVFCTKKLIWTA